MTFDDDDEHGHDDYDGVDVDDDDGGVDLDDNNQGWELSAEIDSSVLVFCFRH